MTTANQLTVQSPGKVRANLVTIILVLFATICFIGYAFIDETNIERMRMALGFAAGTSISCIAVAALLLRRLKP